MRIRKELNSLKETDLWSLVLFALFKLREIPEYSGISELAYVLDKPNLLKLCEYFGGTTIRIPTIEDLELCITSLLLYQYVDIDMLPLEDALKKIDTCIDARKLKNNYIKIKSLLESYSFSGRSSL